MICSRRCQFIFKIYVTTMYFIEYEYNNFNEYINFLNPGGFFMYSQFQH